MVQKHKQPLDQAPSSFVSGCLDHKNLSPDSWALDLACGYGRHSYMLESRGYSVVSADLALDGLRDIKHNSPHGLCVCLDAGAELPFCDHSFNLILIVHYAQMGLISRITRLISPGGFLLYETYGGQGANWWFLPAPGEIEEELGPHFSVLTTKERSAGPPGNHHVNIKIFARKLHVEVDPIPMSPAAI